MVHYNALVYRCQEDFQNKLGKNFIEKEVLTLNNTPIEKDFQCEKGLFYCAFCLSPDSHFVECLWIVNVFTHRSIRKHSCELLRKRDTGIVSQEVID